MSTYHFLILAIVLILILDIVLTAIGFLVWTLIDFVCRFFQRRKEERKTREYYEDWEREQREARTRGVESTSTTTGNDDAGGEASSPPSGIPSAQADRQSEEKEQVNSRDVEVPDEIPEDYRGIYAALQRKDSYRPYSPLEAALFVASAMVGNVGEEHRVWVEPSGRSWRCTCGDGSVGGYFGDHIVGQMKIRVAAMAHVLESQNLYREPCRSQHASVTTVMTDVNRFIAKEPAIDWSLEDYKARMAKEENRPLPED